MKKNKDKKIKDKEIEVQDVNEDVEQKLEEAIDDLESETNIKDEPSIAELEEKIQSLQDTVLRKAAEFENYKRRTENDQLNLFKYAAESFILKILPVYDDLGRSVDHLSESNIDSLKEGLKLVYDKFTKILDEQGVAKLDVKGKEFDVEFHEALMQQPSNEVAANTVLNEIEAGYMYKDKVIKHAKVVVSQGIAPQSEEDNDSQNDIEG